MGEQTLRAIDWQNHELDKQTKMIEQTRNKEIMKPDLSHETIKETQDIAPVEKVIPASPQPMPENMKRVYDPGEEYYFLRPTPQTESIPKTVSKPKGASPLVH